MQEEDDPPAGIPEWVVTFGDMMSLLLTFFIMLVSMSELKQEEKFQAIVESMRQQFGHNKVLETLAPGDVRPRPSENRVMSTEGRARMKDTAKGGVPEKSPYGEERMVRIIRMGQQTAIGTVIHFEPGSEILSDAGKASLNMLAEQLRGKPQKIEIRGHTSPEVAARSTSIFDPMDLSYARSRIVMRYLIEKEQIEPQRLRIAACASNEPMFASGSADKMSMNPRVEVFLLDETAEDLKSKSREQSPNSTAVPPNEESTDG